MYVHTLSPVAVSVGGHTVRWKLTLAIIPLNTDLQSFVNSHFYMQF